jgi:hypothetical protein
VGWLGRPFETDDAWPTIDRVRRKAGQLVRQAESREEASGLDALAPAAGVVVVRLRASPSALPAVTAIRSTLITSSLRTLEERGLIDHYFTLLAPEHTATLRGAIAGTWLPVDVAVAHYRACNGLGLSTMEQLEMGRRVGEKIQGTLLGTLVAVAKQAGVTPWTFLEKLDRLYDRLTVGGGIAVTRVAEKDALIEIYKVPLFETAYFAHAWRGVIQGICDLFCTRAYVKAGRFAGEKMTYVIAWA